MKDRDALLTQLDALRARLLQRDRRRLFASSDQTYGVTEPSFTGPCLPRTMVLAHGCEDMVLPQLSTPSKWPYEDRVLAWLMPSLLDAIEAFQNRKQGCPAIETIHQKKELARLDNHLVNTLGERLTQEDVTAGDVAASPVLSDAQELEYCLGEFAKIAGYQAQFIRAMISLLRTIRREVERAGKPEIRLGRIASAAESVETSLHRKLYGD